MRAVVFDEVGVLPPVREVPDPACPTGGVVLDVAATALAELPDHGPTTARDWQRVSAQWQDELQARIDELVALRDAAERCIGCGCLSTERCGLVNPGDVLAAEGPGARRLGE